MPKARKPRAAFAAGQRHRWPERKAGKAGSTAERRDKSRNREVAAQYGKAKKKRGQQNLAEEQNKEQSRGA